MTSVAWVQRVRTDPRLTSSKHVMLQALLNASVASNNMAWKSWGSGQGNALGAGAAWGYKQGDCCMGVVTNVQPHI
eukprot:12204668-Alexandrium_andersonii.AAC.1